MLACCVARFVLLGIYLCDARFSFLPHLTGTHSESDAYISFTFGFIIGSCGLLSRVCDIIDCRLSAIARSTCLHCTTHASTCCQSMHGCIRGEAFIRLQRVSTIIL